MKSQLTAPKTGLIQAGAIALWLVAAATSQAGLTLQLQLIDNGQGGVFTCSPNLSTNANGADATPITYHQVRSPHGHYIGDLPSNGNDNRDTFPLFNDFMQELTNGTWQLIMNVGDPSQHTYFFTVSTTNLTTDSFATVTVDFPADGATNVPELPNFEWHGPTDWNSLIIEAFNSDVSVFRFSGESPSVTNATLPPALPPGNYNFGPDYQRDGSTFVASATPRDASNNPAPGWVSTGLLDHGAGVGFTVVAPVDNSTSPHSLVAHYAFDSGNFYGDSSGNGNDIHSTGNFDNSNPTLTTTSIAGGGAAQLDGADWFILPTNLLQTIAGSYSISLWLNTTQSVGANNDQGDRDLGIVWAYVGGGNDSVPMAMTGSKLGFFTDNPADTLNSATSINSGPNNFTHIVVTRDQSTGAKKIYINGNLDASDAGGTNRLDDSTQLLLGMDPFDGVGVNGIIDDVQFYSGVLNGTEVAALYHNPGATAPNVAGSGIVAHYTFDDPNDPGADSSGHGFDLDFNGGSGVTTITDAKAGANAAYFDGNSYLTYSAPPAPVMAAFAGDFTLSLWIKTSQSDGNDNDAAWQDAGIVAADIPGQLNDIIPMALTGGAIAFGTGPDDDHINSTVDINDDLKYHHVVVTRNQATGEKQMYIDGTLNINDFATTNLLDDPITVGIGASVDASQPNPQFIVNGNHFNGQLDDMQLYSRVLSASEIAFLFNNPGLEVGVTQVDFNPALNTTNLNWITSGDSDWLVETSNTLDNAAAQSGPVTGNQSSTLSVTVTGPGLLSFFWSTSPNGDDFDFIFSIDGNEKDDLDADSSWFQENWSVDPGQHTLTWTATANGDTDPTEAGFLDQVSYIVATVPVITVNPFDQTNHPGYPVGLIANATSTVPINWQWFKVGSGAISNATTPFFSPTNSGSPSVAGNYFAVATTAAGSANSTTCMVSFASAPLPPDWTYAFKSLLEPQDESATNFDYFYGCVLDTNGNIYSADSFSGNLQVNDAIFLSSSPGNSAGAVVKDTPGGEALWVAAITNNGVGNSQAFAVATAPGGGVYLAGEVSGTNFIGTNQLTDAGSGDVFIARFDANGSNLWVRTLGTTSGDFTLLNSLTSDPSGNATFMFELGTGSATIGSSNYTITGLDGFVVQFDPTGAVRWSQRAPGEICGHVAYGPGRIYVSINTTTAGVTTNAAIGGMTNVTDRAWALAALNDTNGQVVWIRGVGTKSGSGSGNPFFTGLADDIPRIAAAGADVFITGVAYDTSATFGALTVNFGAQRGEYLARYDTNGMAQSATAYGSVSTTPEAIVADTQGDVYVSGNFDTASFYGVDMLAAPRNRVPGTGGFSQAFLAKFDRNGNPQWARQAVSPATVNFFGLAVASNSVWASGFCISTNTATGYTPTQFGSNYVFSDVQVIVSGGTGFGTIEFLGLPGGVLGRVTDTSSVATINPVTLINEGVAGGNFQFSFVSTSGHTNFVQFSTNLNSHAWLPFTNFVGDGTLKTFSVPANSPSQKFFRVSTP